MNKTYFGLEIFENNLVKENDIKKLPFYEFWDESAKEKWTQPVHNWSLTISQLAIFFEGRLDNYLEL